MAHTKVYGVCENKCQVEVSPKSEQFELVKTETIKIGTPVEINFYRYKNMVLVQCSGEWQTTANANIAFPEGIPRAMGTFRNNLLYVKAGLRKITLNGRYFDNAQLMFIVGNDELTIACEVSKSSAKVNEKVVIRAEVEGGTFDYSYYFSVHDLDNDTWTSLQTSNKLSTVVWIPTSAGNYEILASVRDTSQTLAQSDLIPITVT